MSFFGKAAAAQQQDLNSKHSLPFQKKGDTYSNSFYSSYGGYISYHITFIGHDTYSLLLSSRSSITSVGSTIMPTGLSSGLGSGYNPSSQTTITAKEASDLIYQNKIPTNVGLSTPDPLTKEEEKELRQLEEESTSFIKNKKIEEFKKIPKNIRQRIVDVLVLKTFCNEIGSINENSFDKIDKLRELRRKQSLANSQPYYNGLSGHYTVGIHPSTFTAEDSFILNILDNIPKDDILKAHAEISLEEELRD